jgi:class 3 adenylate cyclase
MAACPACRAENPDGTRFCSSCATPLGPVAALRDVRKVVTILFADVTGSTVLGEQLDPETMRTVMGRYFAMMKAVIERHGGTVEKFIGDAVMAVFGIPTLHEDDALRAVRAAADIATELATLNAELSASRGVAIQFRTGVNTGEVVAGDPATGQTLVTGDTVNTAARLEQAAAPGEILLGALTWSLVRDAVEAEPVEPIAAKGKALPIVAYRLLSVRPGEAGRRRRLDRPLVGRERELTRLEDAFRQAVADRAAGLFTLLGAAGIGKSRLVAEFLAGLAGEATVLRGHCLSYGEGITYWPIGEIVRSAAGIDEADTAEGARAKLRAVFGDEGDGDLLAARVGAAIGLSAEAAPQEEIFWAIRRLLEHLARQRPLIVVVEDIHWAEPTLLDLLEYIVDWSRDAPFLLLCPARPELLDERTGWGGTRVNATTLLLESLPADASGRLIANLPGGAALPGPVVERIQDAAEGNPLYIEEFLAMLVDDGLVVEGPDGAWRAKADLASVRVPASISALLAARLEQLAPSERAVAERGSVVGRVFEAAAVSELADAVLRPVVGRSLLALVRKEFVRPDRSELSPGDAFRFRHILIRDAAYAALPKSERAELHERFADWLERTAGERIAELEEIVGHHLDAAYRYRNELGEKGEALERLGRRAGERLAGAGQAAHERGDGPAAAELLASAAGQIGPDTELGRLLRLELALVLFSLGRLGEMISLMEQLSNAARAVGDVSTEAQARMLRMEGRSHLGEIAVTGPEFAVEIDAIEALMDRFDTRTASIFWQNKSVQLWERSNFDGSEAATLRQIELATQSGDRTMIFEANFQLGIQLLSGPASVAEASAQFEAMLGSPGLSKVERADIGQRLAILRAMDGNIGEARTLIADSLAVFAQLGAPLYLGQAYVDAGWVERLAQNLDGEIEWLTRAVTTLRAANAEMTIPHALGRRALAEAKQGAGELARRDLAAAEVEHGSRPAILCALARGHILLQEGDGAGAIGEIDRADVLSHEIGKFVNIRSEALIEIAAVCFGAGLTQRAIDSAADAVTMARAKGNRALLSRAEDDWARYGVRSAGGKRA